MATVEQHHSLAFEKEDYRNILSRIRDFAFISAIFSALRMDLYSNSEYSIAYWCVYMVTLEYTGTSNFELKMKSMNEKSDKISRLLLKNGISSETESERFFSHRLKGLKEAYGFLTYNRYHLYLEKMGSDCNIVDQSFSGVGKPSFSSIVDFFPNLHE